ncbi:MAG: hypothetical protein ACFFGZ_18785 [Candidatus Thorarchaeota archaeon]
MDFISFFGQILAGITEKPRMACSAFIRLALKDAGKDLKLTGLTRRDLEEVFTGPLKKRLAALQLGDVEGIINQMLLELEKNHALFVMSA